MDLLRASLSGVFLGLLFHRLGLPGGAVVGAMLGTGLAQLLAALAFLALALLLAFLLAKPLGQPPKALLFALAPGGITGMGPLSQAEGGSPALVGVFHTVRVLALFLLVPLLARLLR